MFLESDSFAGKFESDRGLTIRYFFWLAARRRIRYIYDTQRLKNIFRGSLSDVSNSQFFFFVFYLSILISEDHIEFVGLWSTPLG